MGERVYLSGIRRNYCTDNWVAGGVARVKQKEWRKANGSEDPAGRVSSRMVRRLRRIVRVMRVSEGLPLSDSV